MLRTPLLIPMSDRDPRQTIKDEPSVSDLLRHFECSVHEIISATAGSSLSSAPFLTRQDPAVRNFCQILDSMLSRDLRERDRVYWRAVCPFMSREQCRELEERWHPKSPRAYSLAWLYQSLNDKTLSWQMMSFAHSPSEFRRFYKKDALLLDEKLLNQVANSLMEVLENVNFDLSPPEPATVVSRRSSSAELEEAKRTKERGYSMTSDGIRVPLAVPSLQSGSLETSVSDVFPGRQALDPHTGSPTIANLETCMDALNFDFERALPRKLSSRSSGRPRSRTAVTTNPKKCVATFSYLKNTASASKLAEQKTGLTSPLVSPPTVSTVLSYTGAVQDKESVLWELLGRRGSPEGVETPAAPVKEEEAGKRGQELLTSVESVRMVPGADARKMEQTFSDQVLNRLERVSTRLSTASDSWELDSEPRTETETENLALHSKEMSPQRYEGEIALDSSEIVHLALEVFAKEGELYYKLFRVFLGHHTGAPLMRFLLLTNHAMYLLVRNGRGREAESTAVNNDVTSARSSVPRYQVDYMLPLQQIDFVSVGLNAQLFTLHSVHKQNSCVLCTGSELLTRSIMSSLELAVRRCGPSLPPPSVLTDATPQRIALQKWASNELHKSINCIPVSLYSLVYWKSIGGAEAEMGAPSRSSYLYCREFRPQAWFRRVSEWQYNYFILRKGKLYQFSDSSCKFGVRIIDLQSEVSGCREARTRDQQFCLELLFHSEESVVQLACQTRHDCQQWLSALLSAISQGKESEETEEGVGCFLLLTEEELLMGQETGSLEFVRSLAVLPLCSVLCASPWRSFQKQALALEIGQCSEFAGSIWWLCFRSPFELDKAVCAFSQMGVSVEEDPADSSLKTESLPTAEYFSELRDFWRTCSQV